MRHTHSHKLLTRAGRPGITLVELIVVITIIGVLAALTLALIPTLRDKGMADRGADKLQGTLLIARQRALRDRSPRGVRLLPSATNPDHVTQLQYIEQPEDFYVQYPGSTRFPPRIRMVNVRGNTADLEPQDNQAPDFSSDLGATNTALWPVQIGDYLELQDSTVHRITAVAQWSLTIDPPVGTPIVTENYRIFRAPRPLSGEEPVALPDNIVIDLKLNRDYGNLLPPRDPTTRHCDILFAPDGRVLRSGAQNDKIILWVRDTRARNEAEGDPTLIVVHVRTGFIAAHPVDPTPNPTAPPLLRQPYTFTRNARSSGM